MSGLDKAKRRLMADLNELKNSPVENVSAFPLEDNMFEWHCNIKQDDIIYHLILFFPPNYPYESPSAEFVPIGYRYYGGATMQGKKGMKVCLNIFSDFAHIHKEWKDQKGLGWSPGYTVQMILMNVVAFLSESQSSSQGSDYHKHQLNISKKFKCDDCGHTYSKPCPSFEIIEGKKDKGKGKGKGSKKEAVKESENETRPQIIDYISKEKFQVKKPSGPDDLFGYGLAVGGTKWRPLLTSPCEFISGHSFFGMLKSVKVVHSVLKEKLSMFLPLYIHPLHGAEIQSQVEKTLLEVAKTMPKYDPKTSSYSDLILKLLPNLMSATVVEFSKGTQHTSDNSLYGYFALHRLLLWATDTYPGLQEEIERQVQEYVEDESNRTKTKVPYIAEWLMLVAASKKYRWKDVADAYLSESWKRNVIWYVKSDEKLGYLDTPKDYRIRRTLEETVIARKHLAFQVCFLDIAMPSGMTREQVIKRYDDNLGFPTPDMVKELKEAFVKIDSEMKTYQDWFKILKYPVLSDDEVYSILVDAVRFSIVTPGYYWTNAGSGNGWAPVFAKYADMRKKAMADTKKTDEEKETKPAPAAEKGKETGQGSARGGRGRGKGASAARGKKRKISEENDDDEDNEEEKEEPTKAAKGRGRGRGRGGPTKRGRR